MEELINYFKALEARLAAQDERIAALEAQVAELQNRPLPEPVIKEVIKEVVVEKPVVIEKTVEVPVPAPAAEPEPAPVAEEPVAEPEPAPVAEPEPAPVIEEPAPAPAPVVEEVASPNAALYGKAVDDIRQAISLGDRFLYQRELFGQNAELMQRTLTDLNNLGSFDEAVAYISSRFQWDTESSTYQQFLVTLHRRFG